MSKNKICIIANCGNDLSPRSELEICPLCRSTLYRWSYRRPAEVLQRRARLVMYSDRMTHVEGGKRK
jgi:hypothetical protein